MASLRFVSAATFVSGLFVLGVACGGDEPGGSPEADGGEAGPSGTTTTTTPVPTVLPDGAIVTPDADIPFEPGVDGGPANCGGTALDPAGAATVEGYMDTLPNRPPAGATRTQAVDAILKTCSVFGPSTTNPGWTMNHCWAFLAASISKESGYNAQVSVKDGYATRNIGGTPANDPVVGLLQIRFSSTVHEMVALGETERLACVGCAIPASVKSRAAEAGSSSYWAVTGPSQNMSLMQNVACNVGMGAWFYFVNSSGNGKASAVTYPDAYCAGTGTAGNLITGLLSHLKGSEGGRGFIANQAGLNALQGTDAGAYQYVTQIKTWFDGMLGASAGTHPFFLRLAPNPTQYCL